MLSHETPMTGSRQVDICDPSTGVWSSASPMSKGRKFHAATLLKDGTLLIVGDETSEIYDPVTDTWTSAGKLNIARFDSHTATLLSDGRVLVVGGSEGANPSQTNYIGAEGLTSVEIYDPVDGWQLLK